MTAETARDAVELVPLSETTWRVCDARNGGGGGGGAQMILGYLTAVDEQFEMLWMRPRAGVTRRYTTYPEAVDAIATRLISLD